MLEVVLQLMLRTAPECSIVEVRPSVVVAAAVVSVAVVPLAAVGVAVVLVIAAGFGVVVSEVLFVVVVAGLSVVDEAASLMGTCPDHPASS